MTRIQIQRDVEKRRKKAVELCLNGASYAKAGRVVGRSGERVRQWIKRWCHAVELHDQSKSL